MPRRPTSRRPSRPTTRPSAPTGCADRLRLIFTCCHPALAPEARVALTLREVCGRTTEAIARAFLLAPATRAQRLVRAKAKIRAARIPDRVPARRDRAERLDAVRQVLYLVFTEGHAASDGDAHVRTDPADEAIRLGRLLAALLPEPEVHGPRALGGHRRRARLAAVSRARCGSAAPRRRRAPPAW